ncbi:MAG: AMP-binding protein, partial [Firmicutes bacterium]|nr:AMP-binding protein [Bacillota bacterium]
LRLPEETARAVDREGWFYTGDLGVLDERGYLRLVGRLKEMYITGGYNVYPAEIEDALTRHPAVLMAACLGVPDPVLGEVGRAYVVCRPGAAVGEAELVAFLRERLADYKIPRQYVFREALPLTPLGKIDKKALAAEIRAETR